MHGYETALLGDVERADGWSPVRRFFDIRSFGVNAWTAHEVGAVVIPDHDEEPTGHEELYVVIEGDAGFNVDGDEVDAPAGTLVFVREPSAMRGAIARAAGTTVLTIGAKPGEPYARRSWETNWDVIPLLDAGKHEKARRLLTDALTEYDDRSELLYNLACAEAQLGEIDAALDHLRAVVTDRPSLADAARQDHDLEQLRRDPRFVAAIAP